MAVLYYFDSGGDEALKEASAGIASNNISVSYLSQFSTEVTIGEAFNKFFGEPKWKSYNQGIQKYVDFQGKVIYNNEPAIAVITFSILGDNFKVESVKIDNEPLNDFEIDLFFETVFADSR